MAAHPKFRISAWLAGSLFGLLVINLMLVVFVSGADVLLGQPPQVMAPLFALIVAAAALVSGRRSLERGDTQLAASSPLSAPEEPDVCSATRANNPRLQWSRMSAARTDAQPRLKSVPPAYLSMTIIKRTPAYSASPKIDQHRGVMQ